MAVQRRLKARHLVMMSVGGTIGTGLFVGSGIVIATAGPAGALAAFAIVGFMVLFILNALGEMSAMIPLSGSFHEFASRFLDPALGFVLGWSYWLQWAVSFTSEITAAGIIASFWFPDVPTWVFSLTFLILLVLLNTASISVIGEVEFWLSVVKVVTVIIFIIAGVVIDIIGFPDSPGVIGFKNWNIEGAPFKNGLSGIFSMVSIAFFAFELVGVSAGEVEDPKQNIPRAITQTFSRISIFYIASVLIIGLLIPNDDPNLSLAAETNDIAIAPFTLIFLRSGITASHHIMNLVILSAVVSAANSAMYAASRTLMALAIRNQAPRVFGFVDQRGVPLYALALTTLVGSIAFLGVIVGENVVFESLLTCTGTAGLLSWLSISVSHIRFRWAIQVQKRDISELPFYSKLLPIGNYIALVIGFGILIGQAYNAFDPIDVNLIISVYVVVPLFFTLYFGYKYVNDTAIVSLDQCNFDIEDEDV